MVSLRGGPDSPYSDMQIPTRRWAMRRRAPGLCFVFTLNAAIDRQTPA